MKHKVLIGLSLCSVLLLTACVSEQSYKGSDKPVSDRTFDNIEAARTRISLGLNYLRRGDTSQAKYNLERARSFAPNSAEVYGALAYYYQSVGENAQAEDYFKQAISKDNNYADAYNNYGAFLCQIGRYEQSEQLLLKAISRPGYIRVAESYENLALCQLQQNSFTKAKTYLDNSLSHNSTRITSLTMAAGLSYAMGDNRQAKSQLDRIQRLGRVSARTVLLSYLIAEKSGDRETMRNAEQLLLTLYTDTPETRLLLQGKLQDTEFEQLRERYKDSLMANIVLPDDTVSAERPTAPVANPKLKVVKRKSADGSIANAAQPLADSAAVLSNTASAIAGSLTVPAQTAVVASATVPAALPVETIVAQAAAIPSDDATTTMAAEAEAQTQAAQRAEPAVDGDATDSSAAAAGNAALTAEQVDAQVAQDNTDAATEMAATEQVEQAAELPAEPLTEQPTEQLAEQPAEHSMATEPAGTEEVLSATAADKQTVAGDSADAPFHIVQAAESLYAISVKHNIRLQSLMQWNQLTPEAVIKTGQKIWLAEVTQQEVTQQQKLTQQQKVAAAGLETRPQVSAQSPYHLVAAGETMFGISYRYNVRLSSFLSWNNLTENSTLKVGQQVYVVDPASIAQ
ncbi:type IV pilus biogenesis/stability protein PilW [Rheinheimera sp.]|uniref:type IV pilus biogenesis/stability protein PilW n=1 Tax=Rheinheimera sp. TaxID=1869214 RepID=UPI002736C5BD|nr:type IV pilus biogenesis/stability protein PilW [Rheinheimera sp.]MDP2714679.1 type IV pilus biogenesis/stability protein PilW [Rheinheimera sp.]